MEATPIPGTMVYPTTQCMYTWSTRKRVVVLTEDKMHLSKMWRSHHMC